DRSRRRGRRSGRDPSTNKRARRTGCQALSHQAVMSALFSVVPILEGRRFSTEVFNEAKSSLTSRYLSIITWNKWHLILCQKPCCFILKVLLFSFLFKHLAVLGDLKRLVV